MAQLVHLHDSARRVPHAEPVAPRGLVVRFPSGRVGVRVDAAVRARAVGTALALGPAVLVAHGLVAAWFAANGNEIPLTFAQIRWPVLVPGLGVALTLLLAAWPPHEPAAAPWRRVLTEPLSLGDVRIGGLLALALAPVLLVSGWAASAWHGSALLPFPEGDAAWLVLGAAAVGAVQGAILRTAARLGPSGALGGLVLGASLLSLHLHAATGLAHAGALALAALPVAALLAFAHLRYRDTHALVVTHALLGAALVLVTTLA